MPYFSNSGRKLSHRCNSATQYGHQWPRKNFKRNGRPSNAAEAKVAPSASGAENDNTGSPTETTGTARGMDDITVANKNMEDASKETTATDTPAQPGRPNNAAIANAEATTMTNWNPRGLRGTRILKIKRQ